MVPIQKLLFTEGSDVKAGQLLYEINSEPFHAALDSAKADLEKSVADLVTAQSKFERYSRLLAKNAISRLDYDCEESRLKQTKAHAMYCKAAVETAGVNIKYTRITAPISGRISKSNVKTGDHVAAYQNLPLATIQPTGPNLRRCSPIFI